MKNNRYEKYKNTMTIFNIDLDDDDEVLKDARNLQASANIDKIKKDLIKYVYCSDILENINNCYNFFDLFKFFNSFKCKYIYNYYKYKKNKYKLNKALLYDTALNIFKEIKKYDLYRR